MVREERLNEVGERAERNAEERLLDLLMPAQPEATDSADRTREKLREKLRAGKLDDRMVEIDVKERGPTFEVTTAAGMEEMDINLKDVLPGLFGGRTRKRKMRVGEALDYLVQEEEQKLVDMDQVTRVAIERVERSGIIFLDEIDKIAGREGGHGPDVSREGVQRDILPIVEGTTVNTRYGFVRTDHILFIAAGAFHVSKPSDLIPELQGRFPIRVELKSLTEADFIRILKEPKNALIKQYQALLDTEGIKLAFTEDALKEISPLRRASERIDRKYRRAPPAHDSRKTAGRRVLRRSRPEEEERQGGRRLRPQATGRHRQGSGPEPVYSVKRSGAILLLLCFLAAGGCGYVGYIGPPMAPTLDIPLNVTDLRAVEYGDKIQVTFTISELTTEGLKLKSLRSVDLFAGLASPPADTHYDVPASMPGPVAYDEIPVQAWIGKNIILGVHATGPKKKTSGWSNFVQMMVGPPLQPPTMLDARNLKDGVGLTWKGTGPRFRVLRAAGDGPLERLADVEKPEYWMARRNSGRSINTASWRWRATPT